MLDNKFAEKFDKFYKKNLIFILTASQFTQNTSIILRQHNKKNLLIHRITVQYYIQLLHLFNTERPKNQTRKA